MPPKKDPVKKSVAPKQSKGKGAPKGATTWMGHVKKVHQAGQKKDSSYSYKQAMKDAKSTYTKKK